FSSSKHSACKIVLGQRQQFRHGLRFINFNLPLSQLCTPLAQQVLKALAQPHDGIVTGAKRLAEAMDDGTLERGRQIRRRLRCFSIVPDGKFIRRRNVQDALEVVLPWTAAIIDELRDTKTTNTTSALRCEWVQQWKPARCRLIEIQCSQLIFRSWRN